MHRRIRRAGPATAGRNEIRLTYRLRHAGTAAHVGEVFETERNRFFYPLEPDNVYLRGDFDIEAAGILSSTPASTPCNRRASL